MPELILDDLTFDGGGPIDAVLASWRMAIERANRHEAAGAVTLDAGATGFAWHFPSGGGRPGRAIVGPEGVSTSPDDETYGEGKGTLWLRGDGAALVEKGEVDLYNPSKVAEFVEGDIVFVVQDGDGYLIVGADCPAEPPPEETTPP
jgi:hypothetical protein